MAHAITQLAGGLSLKAGFKGILERFALAKRRNAAYHRVFNELNALTDRELSDIGIARSMIGEVAQAESDRA